MALPGQMWPRPIKGYMDEMMNLPKDPMYPGEDWNQDWNKHTASLMRYISGDITNPVGDRGPQGLHKELDQGTWDKISNWYQKKVAGGTQGGATGYDAWKDPTSEYNRRRTTDDYMKMAMDKPGWKSGEWGGKGAEGILGDYLMNPGTFQVTKPATGADPTRRYLDQKTWQDIANWYKGATQNSGLMGMNEWLEEDPNRRFGGRY